MKISSQTLLKDIAGADIAAIGILARFGILPGYGHLTLGGNGEDEAQTRLLQAVFSLFFGNEPKWKPDAILLDKAGKFLIEGNSHYLGVQIPIIRRHILGTGTQSKLLEAYLNELTDLLEKRGKVYRQNLLPVLEANFENVGEGVGGAKFNSESLTVLDNEIEYRISDLKNFFLVHLDKVSNPGMISGVVTTVDSFLKDLRASVKFAEWLCKGLARADEECEENCDCGASQLSRREKDVLVLLAKGLSNKEVADRLNISVNTAITHRRNLSSKLGIKSLAGLSLFAYTHGMLDTHQV